MSLLDWLSDGLGLGGGTPMQPGPGSMVGGMDPMGNPNGQAGPLPTAAPAPTQPMPPVQMTGTNMPYPPGQDPMTAGGDMPNGPGLPFAPGGDPMAAGGAPPNGPGLPPGARPGAPTDISASGPAGGSPMSLAPPGAVEQFAPSMSPGDKGGGTAKGILESALGLSPERATRVRGNLGAGLKSVAENAHKPGLAAFSGSMGSGIEGGTKSDEKQTDQRTKLLNQMISAQAAGDRASYTKALTEYTKAKQAIEMNKAANPEAAAKGKAAMTEEQKLLKIHDALAKDPQIKAAQHLLESTKRQGSKKDVAEAQKSFDALFATKKTEISEALRPGSQTNPIKGNSQAEIEKNAKPGDIFINPKDGKPYVYKGAAKTPAGNAGLPSPDTAGKTEDDE